jgi:hypothetical protein
LQVGWPTRPGSRPAVEMTATAGQAAPRTRQRQEPGAAPLTAAFPDQWEMVSLTAPDGREGTRTIRLPAVARPTLDTRWLEEVPAAVPAEVLRAFERTGHEVRQHRELLPVEMKDGRCLVVPVDRVEVHYVGRPAY